MSKSTGARLREVWERVAPLPFGKLIFSRILGFMVPYTGSMGAVVEELRPGYARMRLADRKAVRNHLNSVHALALANLGEATSGLAMSVGLPEGVRGIVTSLTTEYLKKARGTLVAESTVTWPTDLVPGEDRDHVVTAEIKNASGEVVARFTANWRLGLAKAAEG